MGSTDRPAHAVAGVRRVLWYVLPVAVGNLGPFLSLPVVLRYLSAAQYGTWALCYAYAVLASAIANFGMTVGLDRNYFEYRTETDRAKLLYSTLVFVAVTSCLVLGFTVAARQALAFHVTGHAANANLLLWTTAAVIVGSLKMYFLIYLRNEGRARSYALFTMDETILATALTIFFVAGLELGELSLAWGPLIASALVFVPLSIRSLSSYQLGLDWKVLMSSLAISVPLAPRLLLGVVATQLDKYVVGLLASVGAVAVYVVGQKIANLVFAYTTALENVFAPGVYRRLFNSGIEPAPSAEDTAAAVGRYLTPFAWATVGVALAVALASEEILLIIAPESYAAAQSVVLILVVHYAVMFFGKQPHLTYARKTWITSALTVVSIALTATITVAAVRTLGLIGAAVGTLVAGVVTTALFVNIGQRYCRIDYDWRKLTVLYGYLVIACGVLAGLHQMDISYGARLASKILLGSLFVGMGFSFGIVDREVLGMLIPRRRARSSAAADSAAPRTNP